MQHPDELTDEIAQAAAGLGWVTLDDAAAATGQTWAAISHLASTGQIPVTHIGRMPLDIADVPRVTYLVRVADVQIVLAYEYSPD